MTVGRIPSVEGGIQPTIVDAKGDLIVATAADTVSRLAVGGTNGHTLQVDSSTSTGLKWAAASSPSYTWTSFTPTWTNVTVGNASVNSGVYLQIDKIVFVKVNFTLGSTSSFTGHVKMAAPVTGTGLAIGYQTYMRILDAGTRYYIGLVDVTATGGAELYVVKSDSTYADQAELNGTTPITFATNDTLYFSYFYQAS